MRILPRQVAVAALAAVVAVSGGATAAAQSGGGGGKPDNERPTASFGYSPQAPTAGEPVTFTSTSQPSQGHNITTWAWDFDGAGGFDDASGSVAQWTFGAPGTYTVRLRVRQDNGRQAVAVAEVTVVAPPPSGGTPVPPTSELALMSPFPIVRIAGTVLPLGAKVRILSVQSPRGAHIRATCAGTGCPVAVVRRTSRSGLVRLRRFERRLRAGVRLAIFVRRGRTIGKYTRIRIRAGAPPRRLDRCLYPGRTRPARCP
jgi:surface-anchored protein